MLGFKDNLFTIICDVICLTAAFAIGGLNTLIPFAMGSMIMHIFLYGFPLPKRVKK